MYKETHISEYSVIVGKSTARVGVQQQSMINMATITVTKVGSKRKATNRDGQKALKNALGKIKPIPIDNLMLY